jgi:class 3 adenylate cyclase
MMLRGEMECSNAMTRRVVTVMFADLVGFTTLCETMDVNLLLPVLTEYLTVFCEVIMDHQGTLDKVT